MAVVPAKRARLNRARASRDPVIHGRRECTNRLDYWIPALARRRSPARSAGMTGKDVAARRAVLASDPNAMALPVQGEVWSLRRATEQHAIACRSCGNTDETCSQ
jgi:hypothetical protein